MKKQILSKESALMLVTGYTIPSFIHWFLISHHILLGRFIGNLVNLMIYHVDVSTFTALETFLLANITAFIAVYDFINEKQEKKQKRMLKEPKHLEQKQTTPGTHNLSRHPAHGKYKKRRQ